MSSFKLKKVTSFKDIRKNKITELCESDLCFQDKENIYQFEFVEDKKSEAKKIQIKPGYYTFDVVQNRLGLTKIELRKRQLLESLSNTKTIKAEGNKFFSRLHVYDEIPNRPKKRCILFHSKPGLGKTASIEDSCIQFFEEDPGTVVIVWPTAEIEPSDVLGFLSTDSEYDPSCTRLILVIEDIGGGEMSRHRSNNGVSASLLQLLDGMGVVFRLPSLIIATTNHPESLLAELADRPGRFDLIIELVPPKYEERIKLMEFICKRELTESEKKALNMKGTEDFSIAYLEEVVIRSKLDDKTIEEVIKEIIAHRERFNNDFEDTNKKVGIY